MNLFEIKQHVVTFAPQALLLAPFKEIWDCDSSEDKEIALKELAYVYYMADDRSTFQYELDDELRSDDIQKFVSLEDNWIRGQYIIDAIEFYKEMSETTSTKLLRSTRTAVASVSTFLDTVDPNERDARTKKPIFSISMIVSAIEKMPKLVKALNEIEEEVIKERHIKSQTGNRVVGVNDDLGI